MKCIDDFSCIDDTTTTGRFPGNYNLQEIHICVIVPLLILRSTLQQIHNGKSTINDQSGKRF
jgi:hypothetical protein